MREVEFSVPATLEDVARATARVRELLPEWMGEDERNTVELGVAEALTNIVEHGFGGKGGQPIRLRMTDRPGALVIDLWDSGRPIPDGLLEQADETTFQYDTTDMAQLPEGGLGLALIKTAFHEVRYRRRQGLNRLQMVRRM